MTLEGIASSCPCNTCRTKLCRFVVKEVCFACIEFHISHSTSGPGLRGAVQILSTVPTVDWVLLGSGESNKG